MLSVLLVDDHPIVRLGLRKLLSELPTLTVAAEADSAGAIDLVRRCPFDLALLDLSLPDRSGFRMLRRMRIERPAMRVVICSAHEDEAYVARAFEAGACGYLMKASATNDLLDGVRDVLLGRRAIARPVATATRPGDAQPPLHAVLSSRELEVFVQIASGMTRQQIARRHSVAVTTVAAQRMAILAKLRLRSGSELAYYAVKHRLIP